MESGGISRVKPRRRVGRRRRHHGVTVCERRPSQCSQDERNIALKQWMKRTSGFRCSLIPATFPDIGRGLMTKSKISTGEVLVSLPNRLLITTKTVLNTEIGHFIKSWEPKVTPQTCLSIFLLWEQHKAQASDWFNYIQVLPTSFTTPAYFSTKELSFLPSSVRQRATEEWNKIWTVYRHVKEICERIWPAFNKVLTYEKFRWAWCVVNTRTVFYESEKSIYISDAEPNNIALAPFLDLLNHSPTANIKASFNNASNCYEIVTFDTYKKYDQVFISYGCHGNHKLFLEYGFCVPDNPQDEFEFVYDDLLLICEDFKVMYQNKKMCVLRENNLLQSLSCSMDGLSWKLWTVLKTLSMDWHQLKMWNKIYTDETVFDSTIPMATAIAKHLLQKYLSENTAQQVNINKNTLAVDNQEHVQICRQMLGVERQILTASLHRLG